MKLIDNNRAREHDFPCDHERVFGEKFPFVSLNLPHNYIYKCAQYRTE